MLAKTELEKSTNDATKAAADHVINASAADLSQMPSDDLVEILDGLIKGLEKIREVGIGRRIITLSIMREKLLQLPLM